MHGSSTGPVALPAPYRSYASVLCCPRCRSALDEGALMFRCTNAACALSSEGFPIVDGRPALIDFPNSLVDRAALLQSAGGSAVERRESFASRLRELTVGVNAVAVENGARFVAELKRLKER